MDQLISHPDNPLHSKLQQLVEAKLTKLGYKYHDLTPAKSNVQITGWNELGRQLRHMPDIIINRPTKSIGLDLKSTQLKWDNVAFELLSLLELPLDTYYVYQHAQWSQPIIIDPRKLPVPHTITLASNKPEYAETSRLAVQKATERWSEIPLPNWRGTRDGYGLWTQASVIEVAVNKTEFWEMIKNA